MLFSLDLLAFSDRIESDSHQQLYEKCAGALSLQGSGFFHLLSNGRYYLLSGEVSDSALSILRTVGVRADNVPDISDNSHVSDDRIITIQNLCPVNNSLR